MGRNTKKYSDRKKYLPASVVRNSRGKPFRPTLFKGCPRIPLFYKFYSQRQRSLQYFTPIFSKKNIRSTLCRQLFLKGQAPAAPVPAVFFRSTPFLRSLFKEAVRSDSTDPLSRQYLYLYLTSTKTACRSDKRRGGIFHLRRKRPTKIADYRAISIPQSSVCATRRAIFGLNENALKNIPVRRSPTKCIPPAPTLNRIVRKMLPPFVKNFRNP